LGVNDAAAARGVNAGAATLNFAAAAAKLPAAAAPSAATTPGACIFGMGGVAALTPPHAPVFAAAAAGLGTEVVPTAPAAAAVAPVFEFKVAPAPVASFAPVAATAGVADLAAGTKGAALTAAAGRNDALAAIRGVDSDPRPRPSAGLPQPMGAVRGATPPTMPPPAPVGFGGGALFCLPPGLVPSLAPWLV
jgi:hypothetical protein